jgi:hypothetical protein
MKILKVEKVTCSDGTEFDHFADGLRHEKALLLAARFGGEAVAVTDIVSDAESIISLLRWNGVTKRDPFAPRKKRERKAVSVETDDGDGDGDGETEAAIEASHDEAAAA